jgi:N-acetyl-anhydromuramyl-L-alanine amidase AmpD
MRAFFRRLFAKFRKKKMKRLKVIPVEEKKSEPVEPEPTPEPEKVEPEKVEEKEPKPKPEPEPIAQPILSGEELDGDEVKSEFKKGATMYPEGIKDYENQFDTTLTDSDGVKYDVTKITSFPFPLAVLKPKGVNDFFYPEEQNKTAIALHFTVGYLMGDLATLIEQSSHLSVPFVIGRNGTVYQLFNSKYWAYHLGRGTIGGNTNGSKRSIAIELSNIGPLTRHDGELHNIYGSKYCTVAEKPFYTKLDNAYRKYTYYSTFTEEQYDSLSKLISYLCSKHNIPREFLQKEKRYSLFSSTDEAQTFEGICSHVNFRAYGKVDIGPAFEWDRITDI